MWGIAGKYALKKIVETLAKHDILYMPEQLKHEEVYA